MRQTASQAASKDGRPAAHRKASAHRSVQGPPSSEGRAQMRARVTFGRLGGAPATVSAERTVVWPVARGNGTPGLADRLGMFQTGSSIGRMDSPIEGSGFSGEQLAPLLPPICNRHQSVPVRSPHPMLLEQHRSERQRRSMHSGSPKPTSAATQEHGPWQHARLTARGYTAVLLVVAGLVAGVAAVSQSAGSTLQTTAAAMRTTTVVIHEGETISSLAAHRAQGSDPAALADTIRALNGLDNSDVPLPGDVLVVPAN